MPHCHAIADDGGISLTAVDHAVVLNIGPFPDDDLVFIAPKDSVKPDTAVLFKDNVPDHVSAFRDKDRFIYFSHCMTSKLYE